MIAGTLELQMLANLARLADDMQKAKAMVSGAMGTIEKAVASAKTALGALGIGLSAGYFVGLIKGAIDAQDHLNDLRKSTSLTIEQLSGLKLLAKQSGSDLDGMAQSIAKLSVNMGKEPEKYRALGLAAKDPLENFKKLADIFVAIQDPEQRAAVMATALGKAWQGAAPALAEGGAKIQEIIDKGAALSGITKENAEQADKFNDQLAELKTSSDALWISLANNLVPALTRTVEAFRDGIAEGGTMLGIWRAIRAFTQQDERQWNMKQMVDVADEIERLERGMASMPKQNIPAADIEDLANLKTKYAAHKAIVDVMAEEERKAAAVVGVTAAAAAAAKKTAEDFLAYEKRAAEARAAEKKAAAEQAAELKLYASALQQLEEKAGRLNGITEEQLVLNRLMSGSLQTLTFEHGLELLEVAHEIDVRNRLIQRLEVETNTRQQLLEVMQRQEEVGARIGEENRREIEDMQFRISLIGKTSIEVEKMNSIRSIQLRAMENSRSFGATFGSDMGDLGPEQAADLAAGLQRIQDNANSQILIVTNLTEKRIALERDWATGAKEAFDDYVDHAGNAAEQARQLFTNAFQGMEDALVKFVKTGKLDFASLADSIISDLIRIQVRQNITKPLAEAMGGSGGFLSSIAGAIGSAFGFGGSAAAQTDLMMFGALPGRAAGGRVMAGHAYMVGERGPEPFIPESNGTIMPNGAFGGKVSIVVNDQRTAPTSEPVQISERRGDGGQRQIEVLIRDQVRNGLNNGDFDKSLRNNFGVSRPTIGRG